MAATISIKEVNGAAAGTPTTITTSRFKTDDSYVSDTAYPLVVPAAGSNYSYVKSFYLNADTAPAGGINNVKWFTDGALGWTGVTVQAGTAAAYAQATGTQGTTAPVMSGKTSQADAATFTTAVPLSVPGSIAAATGKISDYVLLQAIVGTTAVAGTVAPETVTWRYDET